MSTAIPIPAPVVSSHLTLSNNLPIPRIHLGVWRIDGPTCTTAVLTALEAGYRGIDSAAWYLNESACGLGILQFLSANPILSRADIFFTTKLRSNDGYAPTRAAIKDSLKECQLGYIDLYLLHAPYGGRELRRECWRAVEDAIEDGEVRCGGVSNFGVRHLEELLGALDLRVVPAVNQIEVHPFHAQNKIVGYCRDKGIVVQAFAPLAKGLKMQDPTLVRVAAGYGVSVARLMLRWGVQRGIIILPKSSKKERILENMMVDFEISGDDMEALAGLDEGLCTDWDPTDAE